MSYNSKVIPSRGNRAWPLKVHQPLPPPIQQPKDESAHQPAVQFAMQPPSTSMQSGMDMHVALNLYNTDLTGVLQELIVI